MSDIVWLASYPKSGNTWLRMLIGSLSVETDDIDINALPDLSSIASRREWFDDALLIDSGLLTHDEIDCLRPALYQDMARDRDAAAEQQTHFIKVHDAYTNTALGEPLLGGVRAAKGAIVIVRDPRDVAPSLANHNGTGIEVAIDFMNDPVAAFGAPTRRQSIQLRQKLLSWSGHVASWLDQRDIPVHLVRYEDFKRDTAGTMLAAMRFADYRVDEAQVERAVRLASFANLQAAERKTGFAEWQDRQKKRRFFRRGESGAWRDELTPGQAARIEAAHAPMMTRLGYALSPDRKVPQAGERAGQ